MYCSDAVWVDQWVFPLVSVGEACKAVVSLFSLGMFLSSVRSSYTLRTASLCARSPTENRVSDFVTVIQDFGIFASYSH